MAGEEVVSGNPAVVPVPAPSGAACCAARDPGSAGECALCKRAICRNCRSVVNAKNVCASCRAQIESDLAAEQAQPARLPLALGGGIVAAILCGAAWALMVVVTNLEIGYAAIGVGFLTGWGVVLGARGKKGRPLQWMAIACAVFGLLVGKYFTVAHFVTTSKGWEGTSIFDTQLIEVFFKVFPDTLSPWDGLWAFIALRVAWRIPKPTTVHVS